MPIDEDLRRYEAPPDNEPEEKIYLHEDVVKYIASMIPEDEKMNLYNVIYYLKESIESIENTCYGIDTVIK